MIEKEKEKTCENCKDEPATILCSECSKCYCDECSEFTHKKGLNKKHKTERIPEGMNVKVTCPLHNDTFRMFCIDDVELCCSTCVMENLHKDHNVVKIADIKQDSKIFSAAEVRKGFAATLKCGTTLNKKIGEVIENINKENEKAKEEIEKTFEEECQKLKDEEDKLLKELEEAYTKATEHLNEFGAIMENARKYNTGFSEETSVENQRGGSVNDKKCSRLMELNIVSEMEKQRRNVERLLGTEMRDLKISWNREARKLSFTWNLFNRAPCVRSVAVKAVSWCEMDVSWEINDDDVNYEIRYTVEMRKEGEKDWEEVKSALTDKKCRVDGLMDDSVYEVRVRCVAKGGGLVGTWSDIVKGRTLVNSFETSYWKKCPDDVGENMKYSVYGRNSRVATSNNEGLFNYCTIIGSTHIPLNTVTSWEIKILKSKYNNGAAIFIGIAPSDINQNDGYNYNKCGWYFSCCDSKIWSGPPHNYWNKEYCPRKATGEYVHTGDSVGVAMDTIKGDLSFVLNGVNLGVAFEEVPLDKPLVPCVILGNEGDSVKLDTSEVENVDSSVPVPSNITTKSITWDSITLTWDEVSGASFYQIEVDGNKSCDISTTNTFTKRGLLPETEHSLRVRTVRGSSLSKWSGVVKGKTLKESFETSCWKKCPNDVDENMKYSVDGRNPRVATSNNEGLFNYCTIIGNAYIPFNAITQWSVKVLKSKYNNGAAIFIGVAPSDINQNDGYNYKNCGWYIYCWSSRLYSGPPHNYCGKEYGPRKGDGEYVHMGDTVGVVVDTTKGELLFVLNGVSLGVAYEGIPLDKPLVPCVILGNEGDSVEIIIWHRR